MTDEEFKSKVFEYLKENLVIDVRTESNYVGDMGGTSLYKDSHTLTVYLEDEPITSTWLS